MNLKLQIALKNKYPINGILIESTDVEYWIQEIDLMGLDINSIELYVIPNTTPNSVYGCLIPIHASQTLHTRKHQKLQLFGNKIYIPEYTDIQPFVNDNELKTILHNEYFFWHPIVGFCRLGTPLDIKNYLIFPEFVDGFFQEPVTVADYPKKIKSFQIVSVEDESATLERMEKQLFPKRESFKEVPLNTFEKGKLVVLKGLFTNSTQVKGKTLIEKNFLAMVVDMLGSVFQNRGNSFSDRMIRNLEELEKRNQAQMDKLLGLFEKNLEEAIKYAIPLDTSGTFRGGEHYSYNLTKRWYNFSLFDTKPSSGTGGGVKLSIDQTVRLKEQYNRSAEHFLKNKEYEKAAFIYLKLLQDSYKAAQTLEEGEFYQEAAAIYIKYCHNKDKAADCYTKGKMYKEAIGIYKELKQHEKAGDLLVKINKKNEAMIEYKVVLENYLNYKSYMSASFLLRNKMDDFAQSQEILMKGWLENVDAYNCLTSYFDSITDEKKVKNELETIKGNITSEKVLPFVKFLKNEFKKRKQLEDEIRDTAYEIISDKSTTTPSIINEIKYFEEKDKELIKDITNWKFRKKK